jgi:hypothetical protein
MLPLEKQKLLLLRFGIGLGYDSAALRRIAPQLGGRGLGPRVQGTENTVLAHRNTRLRSAARPACGGRGQSLLLNDAG